MKGWLKASLRLGSECPNSLWLRRICEWLVPALFSLLGFQKSHLQKFNLIPIIIKLYNSVPSWQDTYNLAQWKRQWVKCLGHVPHIYSSCWNLISFHYSFWNIINVLRCGVGFLDQVLRIFLVIKCACATLQTSWATWLKTWTFQLHAFSHIILEFSHTTVLLHNLFVYICYVLIDFTKLTYF